MEPELHPWNRGFTWRDHTGPFGDEDRRYSIVRDGERIEPASASHAP